MVQVCFACMHVCAHVSLVPQSQERVLDPLQLEFQIMVSYHVCAKNQTWVLWQSSKWLPEWALSLHSPHTTFLLTCCLGRKKKRWKFIFFQVTLLQSTLDVVMIGDLQMALRSSVCVLAGFQDVSPSQRVHSEKCGTSKHTHTPSRQKGCLHEGRQAWYLHMYVCPCINTHVCLTSLFWNLDYYCGWMDVVGHCEPVEVWGQLCVSHSILTREPRIEPRSSSLWAKLSSESLVSIFSRKWLSQKVLLPPNYASILFFPLALLILLKTGFLL